MKVTANALRMGNVIKYKDKLWKIMKQPDHTMPGKGGAFIQVEMRELVGGTKLNERFRSTEAIEKVRLDQKDYQYLFSEGDFLTLMDQETFEQIIVSQELLGDKVDFLQDDMMLTLESYQDQSLNIMLPETVIMEVQETEPYIKGQTATSSFKPAILNNGRRVSVPQFISVGDKIVIRTEDITYVERAKN